MLEYCTSYCSCKLCGVFSFRKCLLFQVKQDCFDYLGHATHIHLKIKTKHLLPTACMKTELHYLAVTYFSYNLNSNGILHAKIEKIIIFSDVVKATMRNVNNILFYRELSFNFSLLILKKFIPILDVSINLFLL